MPKKQPTSNFALALKQWRAESGRSQALAAGAIDVSVGTYRNWEQERNVPTPESQDAVLSRVRKIRAGEIPAAPDYE